MHNNPKFARIEYIGISDDDQPGEHKGMITVRLENVLILRDSSGAKPKSRYAVKVPGVRALFIITPETYMDLQMFLDENEYVAYEMEDDE